MNQRKNNYSYGRIGGLWNNFPEKYIEKLDNYEYNCYGIVYRITNLINGKIYIGQTIKSLKNRFRSHITSARIGNNSLLSNDIRQYGHENFRIQCIDKAKDRNELNKKETYWINQLNSYFSDVGYNRSKSGNHHKHHNHKKHH